MANEIYVNPEATIWFVPDAAAQAQNAIFEVDALGSGAGHQSAQHDFGVGARSPWYEWKAFVQFATNPPLNETIDIYLKTAGTSDSATAHPDNDDGTGDLAVSAEDKLKNLHYIGSIVVDQVLANIEMVASGIVEIRARAVQVVFWNDTADALTSDAGAPDDSGFFLTPVPDQVQP